MSGKRPHGAKNGPIRDFEGKASGMTEAEKRAVRERVAEMFGVTIDKLESADPDGKLYELFREHNRIAMADKKFGAAKSEQ